LGWAWKNHEVIRSLMGAQATEKGNCSKFGGITIDSCKTHPTIIDSIPGDLMKKILEIAAKVVYLVHGHKIQQKLFHYFKST
jgi:hypothetical protein